MINRLEQFFAAIASSGIGRILGYSFLLILPALVLAKDQIQISSTTMEILENHFKHQDLLHIHSACIERINCKNYFERNTEYRQIETKESPQLSLERYGAIGLTSGSIVKGYALYFSDVLDGYIESPIVIDVEIDSNDRNSVKKVLTLIENSYEEISTDYGEYVYLFGEQYRMDGMSLEVFVVETVTEQKDYSIRYLFHYGGPRKGPSYEDNDPLTEYFAKALNVFLISDEEAVRAALLAAAVVARPKQRDHMKSRSLISQYKPGNLEPVPVLGYME